MPRLLTRLLAARGVSAADLPAYFKPDIRNLAAPEDLPGVVEAADIILAALADGRRIAVFGDYDCDGVCATAILLRCLRCLVTDGRADERVVPFLPNRLDEGYGMTDAALARLLREHPDVGLVVTVDNGINSVTQVADLKGRGISVVITDHHLPGSEKPAADALIDPKVAAPASLEGLCGAGVAFFLANRVVSEAKRRGLYAGPCVAGPLLVLAGLATVTDIMPLRGQNRILVSEALARFRKLAPLGLLKLLDRAARSTPVRLTSKDFGFLIGPRINAAGRMASGMSALELLLSDDADIASESARIIDGYNTERRTVEQRMSDEAMAKVIPGAEAQVIELPDGHPGVAGIVAARVLERLGGTGPVFVLAAGHGSARAPDGINVRDAMEACSDVLSRFGGHAAAGGFSVKDGQVDEFRRQVCAYCRRQAEEDPRFAAARRGESVLDAWVDPADLTLDLAERLIEMEPFGDGNAEPVFGLRQVQVSDVRPLGSDGRHLIVSFADRRIPAAVWWGHGADVETYRAKSAAPMDIVFSLGISDYGTRHLELRVIAICPAA